MTPDPIFHGTDAWRAIRHPSEELRFLADRRLIEAWRDYLYSGRVSGSKTIVHGDVTLTLTFSRRETPEEAPQAPADPDQMALALKTDETPDAIRLEAFKL